MSAPLFVYGSLRDAEVRRHVLGAAAERLVALPAEAPDHRVVAWPPRTYPAIVPANDGRAEGLLLTGLTEADIARLDRFEGPEYSRQPIEIIVSGEAIAADVYWPALAVAPAAPDWSLADWLVRHKAAFLAAEAGEHA